MTKKPIRIIELFAGVGGFRLGFEGYQKDGFELPAAGDFETVWANQWEPPGTPTRQFAARCYAQRFGSENFVNEDINKVLNDVEAGLVEIPDADLLCGGFPCQDYSVTKPLSQSHGIEGKKGVLWWDIHRALEMKRPRYVVLENVDRLLKSPSKQRGRDFAIILSCFYSLGYSVEWRVINAAEYGFAQKRKRVYIYAELTEDKWNLEEVNNHIGVFAEAFPITDRVERVNTFEIGADPYEVSNHFGISDKVSRFQDSGVMQDGKVYTAKVFASYDGPVKTLSDIVIPEHEVPEQFFINPEKVASWQYLKGAKKEKRVNKATGFEYTYAEGGMSFPDPLDRPARTILTGEGGAGASRFKHVIQQPGSDRYRRLVPDELDQIQGFPRGWTDTGMTDGHRAFCMGNALVVGIPHAIGQVIYRRHTLRAK
ncbi:DNA (cytosine-5-)-methyltransferase [Rothia terrae]|uniref:DNA (cytosine-5-)-methyltransferase n=1 Tax=Rothia terrae TaxID=396015 RepID=UPI0033EBD6CC